MIVVTSKPVSITRVIKSVSSPRSGGTVLFLGTVRASSRGMKVTKMRLESAKDLAKADLRRICKAVDQKYAVNHIAVEHRVGSLSVGEIIVAIAVGAAHREDAFKACKYIIDELKKTTPIWKKEIGPARERWV
ncbi:MAG: hypothetical protein A3K60_06115 [Euryarchaeota archaeon RBG_19FT_COMBO_56_21]|nr:MAG: hypothetical protein A3K60_06115 [Euryarchaeota archaeon RBG_19FT_COMBO_56_21]